MNFFTVGYVLLALQLNYSWVSGYIVKLVGVIFMLGGIKEITAFRKGFESLKRDACVSGGAFALCAVLCLVFKGKGVVFDIVSILESAVTIGFCWLFVNRLLALLDRHNDLIDNPASLERVKKGFFKISVAAMASVPFDAVYRFFSETTVGAAFEVIAIVLKLAAIVLLITTGLNFNKARIDFNRKHSAELSADDNNSNVND